MAVKTGESRKALRGSKQTTVTSAMPRFTGTRPTASVRSGGKSSARSGDRKYPYFVVCVDAAGNEGSLVGGRIYRVIRPEANDWATWLRVIDEEGEDYLYPAKIFVPVELPPRARRAVVALSAVQVDKD